MPRYIRTKKSKRGYRFAGRDGMGGNLKSLRAHRQRLMKKIADPGDADDQSWAKEWLARVDAEIEKKERGRMQKKRDATTGRFVPHETNS